PARRHRRRHRVPAVPLLPPHAPDRAHARRRCAAPRAARRQDRRARQSVKECRAGSVMASRRMVPVADRARSRWRTLQGSQQSDVSVQPFAKNGIPVACTQTPMTSGLLCWQETRTAGSRPLLRVSAPTREVATGCAGRVAEAVGSPVPDAESEPTGRTARALDARRRQAGGLKQMEHLVAGVETVHGLREVGRTLFPLRVEAQYEARAVSQDAVQLAEMQLRIVPEVDRMDRIPLVEELIRVRNMRAVPER